MSTTDDDGARCRVLITGGAGFLGELLAERLLAADALRFGGAPAKLHELVLLDLVEPPDALRGDPRVSAVEGGIEDALPGIGEFDVVFHLAGVVSGAAEADFDLGMRTNVDGTRAVLEHARSLRVPPVLVFASSLAVFGGGAGPAAAEVDDDTLPRPESSYGAQKFIAEQFVAEYTRKGFLRGRSVRLMTVAVRPGRPNAAASSFLSGIVREPLAGLRAACPVPPDTPVALSSPRRTVDGLVRAAEVDEETWGGRTAMNLPALTTTPREMAAALDRVCGEPRSDLIDWTADPAVAAIVRTWPARFRTDRADRLGLDPEPSFDEIVRAHADSVARGAR